ncbi:hypothetical protein SAMN04489761_3713 [Tenacibaculum sp. MAR_2009_124]|uniref:hypothetical protein n=1 Tax=Tenacibaculum sp. MAR_2009_124 TaxID=1250059 RepID=UPI00089AA743|nr:hypothetical protein [Tenacibaculum sp. MAR_2009_124]SEC83238.1 hypothetical protein SAMN04489761_3713 [Tenacibaculum sp. MAR_2009_124]
MFKFVVHILLFIILTVITQVGGIIYILSTFFFRKQSYKRLKQLACFLTIYSFTTFLIIPKIAPLYGRQKIQNSKFVVHHNFLTVLCNRNYVTPELNGIIEKVGKQFYENKPGIQLVYLDANFPFLNGFPLLPHLSHNDGKKIDLSFIYKTESGSLTNNKPSRSGYGIFEYPKKQEQDTPILCNKKGYWQYDFTKYLTLGSTGHLFFAPKENRILLNILSKQKSVSKIFIEPHLKTRLQLTSTKIRFHGCKAVRHDDHIHLQVK